MSHLLVLGENGTQLCVAVFAQNLVELGFIRAPACLTSLVQLLHYRPHTAYYLPRPGKPTEINFNTLTGEWPQWMLLTYAAVWPCNTLKPALQNTLGTLVFYWLWFARTSVLIQWSMSEVVLCHGYKWNKIISKLFQPLSTSVWKIFLSARGNLPEIISKLFTCLLQLTNIFQRDHWSVSLK